MREQTSITITTAAGASFIFADADFALTAPATFFSANPTADFFPLLEPGSVSVDTGNSDHDGIALQDTLAFSCAEAGTRLRDFVRANRYLRGARIQLNTTALHGLAANSEWELDTFSFDGRRLTVRALAPYARALDHRLPADEKILKLTTALPAGTDNTAASGFFANIAGVFGWFQLANEIIRIQQGTIRRAQFGTTAINHSQDDTAKAIAVYSPAVSRTRTQQSSSAPALPAIIQNILEEAGVPRAKIDRNQITAECNALISARNQNGFTFYAIDQETAGEILAELMRLIGGVLVWELATQMITLRATAARSEITTLNADAITDKPPKTTTSPKQITRSLLTGGYRDITDSDTAAIYSLSVDTNAESSTQYDERYDEREKTGWLQGTRAEAFVLADRFTTQRVRRHRDPVRRAELDILPQRLNASNALRIGRFVEIEHPENSEPQIAQVMAVSQSTSRASARIRADIYAAGFVLADSSTGARTLNYNQQTLAGLNIAGAAEVQHGISADTITALSIGLNNCRIGADYIDTLTRKQNSAIYFGGMNSLRTVSIALINTQIYGYRGVPTFDDGNAGIAIAFDDLPALESVTITGIGTNDRIFGGGGGASATFRRFNFPTVRRVAAGAGWSDGSLRTETTNPSDWTYPDANVRGGALGLPGTSFSGPYWLLTNIVRGDGGLSICNTTSAAVSVSGVSVGGTLNVSVS